MILNNMNYSKDSLRRQKLDRMRPLRVVKYIEYPFVLCDSPIEIEEGYIISDRDTCDVFASFIFKNVSERSVRKLVIRLACYLNQNIPYTNIDFTYSQQDLTFGIIAENGSELSYRESNSRTVVHNNETFGSCVYIPLPESYFTKMNIILLSVEYSNGEVEKLNKVVSGTNKRFSELDDISKLVYSRVNIYQAAESLFPTKVIPQFGSKVWLCCCGNKNTASNGICKKCGREKEWQENNVVDSVLRETTIRMVNDPREVSLHDKTRYAQNKYLENERDIKQKIQQYEKAMENLAISERRKERSRLSFLPKAFIGVIIIALIAFLVYLLSETIGTTTSVPESITVLHTIT